MQRFTNRERIGGCLLTFHLNDPRVLGLAILSDHQGWDGHKTVLSLSSLPRGERAPLSPGCWATRGLTRGLRRSCPHEERSSSWTASCSGGRGGRGVGAHGGLPAISTDNLNANHHDSVGNDRDVLDSRVLSKKSSDGKPMFLHS